MVYEFKFPDVGEGIDEGEIVKWFVKEGDSVKEDDALGQVETDKAVVDIPSPKSGTVLKLHVPEGGTIKVGETMVSLGDSGEKISAAKPASKNVSDKQSGTKKTSTKGQSVVGMLEEAPNEPGEIIEKSHAKTMSGEAQTQKVLAAPAVRKLAMEKKVDLAAIKGSGPQGRVLRSDVEKVSPLSSSVPQQTITVKKKYDDYGYLERIPIKGIRKSIAKHMVEAVQNAPLVTSMEDVDVSKLWVLRKKEKDAALKKGVKLTFLPFIVKATIAALKENPLLNSRIEGEEILRLKYFNIGIATETELGLMVPVIKIAQDKSILQIAGEISDLTDKARSRKIDIMDLKGGTFTITNYGSVGGTYGTPIINYPEAAILGLGRIFDRPVLNESSGKLKNSKVLPVSVTFDHRILDGAQAARFLESLKMFLEDPTHLLLDLK